MYPLAPVTRPPTPTSSQPEPGQGRQTLPRSRRGSVEESTPTQPIFVAQPRATPSLSFPLSGSSPFASRTQLQPSSSSRLQASAGGGGAGGVGSSEGGALLLQNSLADVTQRMASLESLLSNVREEMRSSAADVAEAVCAAVPPSTSRVLESALAPLREELLASAAESSSELSARLSALEASVERLASSTAPPPPQQQPPASEIAAAAATSAAAAAAVAAVEGAEASTAAALELAVARGTAQVLARLQALEAALEVSSSAAAAAAASAAAAAAAAPPLHPVPDTSACAAASAHLASRLLALEGGVGALGQRVEHLAAHCAPPPPQATPSAAETAQAAAAFAAATAAAAGAVEAATAAALHGVPEALARAAAASAAASIAPLDRQLCLLSERLSALESAVAQSHAQQAHTHSTLDTICALQADLTLSVKLLGLKILGEE